MPVPSATYRLQLSPDFDFGQAIEIVPYLRNLGISDLYCSPIFKSVRGSSHGYDVVEPGLVNDELGGLDGLRQLSTELRKHDMGWLQDIVPNHMAFDTQNLTLMDILENGPDSRFAGFYDITWDHVYDSLRGRLLAPFLGKFYGKALEAGEIRLYYDIHGLSVGYYDLRFPLRIESYPEVLTFELHRLEDRVSPQDSDLLKFIGTVFSLKSLPNREHLAERYDQIHLTKQLLWKSYTGNRAIAEYIDETLDLFNGEPGNPASFEKLDHLLGGQYFRLSFWKVASEEINYRRFFTINNLISVRQEDAEVFEITHRLIRELCAEGVFTGLRVDHIDGLNDPSDYLAKLRRIAPDVYLVVEKILEPHEKLPDDWPVAGTTGYDFLDVVNGVFCDTRAEQVFNTIYRRFARPHTSWRRLVTDKKRLIVDKHLGGNVENLAHQLKSISSRDRHGNDITLYGLRRALVETMAHFPVYRTYASDNRFSDTDRQYIRQAIADTLQDNPDLRHELEYLEKFLLLGARDDIDDTERREAIEFVMRFQQATGPLMAKSVEDTCMYIYNRLLSLNEVGSDPHQFGCSRSEFHDFMRYRAEHEPHAMNATATHDTKRGEDARMRLNVLTEMPDEWDRAVRYWRRVRARRRELATSKVPDRNDEYFLYQSLLAFWPLFEDDEEGFIGRLKEYIIKAVREAKVHTAWLKPDEEYETAYLRFIDRLFANRSRNKFLQSFRPFCRKVAWHGLLNSLGQTLVKFTSPGVPDVYRGCELWDFSMVDPDNRRPVNYRSRFDSLDELRRGYDEDREGLIAELLNSMYDGRIKQFLTWRCLTARAEHRELFRDGRYEPLEITGEHERHVIAYLRRGEKRHALVVLPRLTVGLVGENEFPVGGQVWGDTTLSLPDDIAGPFSDNLTGRRIEITKSIRLADLFQNLPFVLAVSA